jgi:hypothetical protein
VPRSPNGGATSFTRFAARRSRRLSERELLRVTPSAPTDRLFGRSIADAKQINRGEGYLPTGQFARLLAVRPPP